MCQHHFNTGTSFLCVYVYLVLHVEAASVSCSGAPFSEVSSVLQYVAGVLQCVVECCSWYGVATISRMLKNTGLFAEYRSLL